MSTELVGWALIQPVSVRAKLVLVYMADVAHTRGTAEVPPFTYYGGWAALGVMLDPDERMTPATRHKAVMRAVAELVRAGVVKAVDNPTGQARRWYRIRP